MDLPKFSKGDLAIVAGCVAYIVAGIATTRALSPHVEKQEAQPTPASTGKTSVKSTPLNKGNTKR